MADKHNDNIPALANTIAADIPDIKENLEFHKDVFENFLTTWSNTDATGAFPTKIDRVAKTANYTMTAGDTYASADISGGSFTFTLLAAATAGAGYINVFKLATAGVGQTLTIDGNASETIDGSTTYTMSEANELLAIICDGSNWEVLAYYSYGMQNQIQQNLLSNSGFGVWSNGTLENVGSAILEDDCADDDTGDWTVVDNLTFDTDHYEWDWNDANDTCYINNGASLVAGKLYQISIDLKDGTAASQQIQMFMNDGAEQTSPTKTTAAGNATHTWTFECATTLATSDIGLKGITDAGGNNIEFKNFTLYEVTPGCVAADTLGPDGWYKTTTLDVHRQHNDATLTKDGSFYSVKLTAGSGDAEVLAWPLDEINHLPEFYQQFAGRTVTFGVWVYSVTAIDNARIYIYDGTVTYSSFADIADTWTWVEVTATVSDNPSVFDVAFDVSGDAADVAYFDQPMLVFGSSIGEGNYNRPPGEIIWLESPKTLTDYSSVTVSADAALNIESQTDGKIPKGVTAANFLLRGECATAEKILYLAESISGGNLGVSLWSHVVNVQADAANWQVASSDGDFGIRRSDTFNIVSVVINAIQYR